MTRRFIVADGCRNPVTAASIYPTKIPSSLPRRCECKSKVVSLVTNQNVQDYSIFRVVPEKCLRLHKGKQQQAAVNTPPPNAYPPAPNVRIIWYFHTTVTPERPLLPNRVKPSHKGAYYTTQQQICIRCKRRAHCSRSRFPEENFALVFNHACPLQPAIVSMPSTGNLATPNPLFFEALDTRVTPNHPAINTSDRSRSRPSI